MVASECTQNRYVWYLESYRTWILQNPNFPQFPFLFEIEAFVDVEDNVAVAAEKSINKLAHDVSSLLHRQLRRVIGGLNKRERI